MKEDARPASDAASISPGGMEEDLEAAAERSGEKGPQGPQAPQGQQAPQARAQPPVSSVSSNVAAAGGGSAVGGGPSQGGPEPAPKGSLSGARKAAVFVLSLDEGDASLVLRSLSDEELTRITAEIASLGMVERDTVMAVMSEFLELEQLHRLVREGGVEQATRLLERTFPRERAQRILQVLSAQRHSLPFAFLEKVEIESLMTFLGDEHPQTLAVILAHLSPPRAAEVLQRLAPETRRDVLERIAALDAANSEALEQVEVALEKHLDAVRFETLGEAGGVRAVAQILRAAVGGGSSLLDDIRQEQPDLAEEIGKHLIVFDDLARLDDRLIQAVIQELDVRVLALALKSAGESSKLKILNNLSRRAAEELREEMDMLGPVRFSEVQAAQRAILEAVLALEPSGQIPVSVRGCEGDRAFF